MLKRKIEEQLEAWYQNPDKKALCIYGARQIGKTTSVREFARIHYENFVELNFLNDRTVHSIFSTAMNAKQIIEQIEVYAGRSLSGSRTLLVLDEIQECPQARTAVKFLVEDGRLDIIETGSLLGVKISEVRSIPVGFEQSVSMYPLDLEEFLWGVGIPQNTIETLRSCFEQEREVAPFLHEEMKKVFLSYLVVGGMPEAVARFIETKNVMDAVHVQNQIRFLYQQDVLKYAQTNQRIRIQEVFSAVPAQLNKPNHRFFLNQIQPKARIKQFEDSFEWLIKAGIVLPSYNVEQPCSPLLINEKRNLFRLFYLDTGMLCSCFEGIQLKILQGDTGLNWGSVLENAVAQNLAANGYPLYYFDSKKYGEIDFVIEDQSRVSLIECQSGKDFRKHPALDKVGNVSNWTFASKIVLCEGNLKREQEILYLPWYLVFLMKKEPEPSLIVHFNLDDLQVPDK